jgi:multiple sugar transport system ATP-binding protein
VSILHLRVDGLEELLNAKVGAAANHISAGDRVGLLPDTDWALAFDVNGRLLS